MVGPAEEKKPYSYFDTPDGEDTFKKLWAILKPTFGIAGGVATLDVFLSSHPKGALPTLGRYAYFGFPIVGIASTFVLTTNTLANVRKQDDKLNWFVGGAAAGSCFGLWAHKPIVGFNMGMALGIAAFLYKFIYEQGYRLFPEEIKVRRGGALTCLRDLSLIADRPGNWTR